MITHPTTIEKKYHVDERVLNPGFNHVLYFIKSMVESLWQCFFGKCVYALTAAAVSTVATSMPTLMQTSFASENVYVWNGKRTRDTDRVFPREIFFLKYPESHIVVVSAKLE